MTGGRERVSERERLGERNQKRDIGADRKKNRECVSLRLKMV